MKRVKDPERFITELHRPPKGTGRVKPSDEELAREGADFMAFAAAFGVAPPKRGPQPTNQEPAAV